MDKRAIHSASDLSHYIHGYGRIRNASRLLDALSCGYGGRPATCAAFYRSPVSRARVCERSIGQRNGMNITNNIMCQCTRRK
eukprot:6206294-Pleurochrysis_carterae.AAC.1